MITKARVVKVKYNVLMSRRTSNIFAMGDVNNVSDNRLDLEMQNICFTQQRQYIYSYWSVYFVYRVRFGASHDLQLFLILP